MALECDVRWSAASEDDPEFVSPIVTDTITLLGAWAERDGLRAVERAAASYWGSEAEWDNAFGLDATDVGIVVEVHGPPAIAGRYHVNLRREVQACAQPFPDRPSPDTAKEGSDAG